MGKTDTTALAAQENLIAPPKARASLGVSLDIARGLAALFVFCFHISDLIANVSPSLGALARYGNMGVPIFFVISGYCMAASAYQVLRRSQPAGSFLRKRFLRIYPAFWASILVIMATPYVLAALSALKSGSFIAPEPRWLALGALDWLQFITLTRVFFSDGMGLDNAFSPLNIVYWTLAIEFQFYLVIYLALLCRKWFVPLLVSVTVASLAVFAFPNLKETGLFLGYWPMFALGLFLYHVLDRNYTLDRLACGMGNRIAVPLLAASVLGFVVLAHQGRLLPLLRTLFGDAALGFAACTAIAFWLLATLEHQISEQATHGHAFVRLPLRAGIFMGSISYSIYLLHTKAHQFPDMLIRQLTTPDNLLYTVTVIGGTIALSWVFYLYFERPFISRRPVS